jgi:hypothetical protein
MKVTMKMEKNLKLLSLLLILMVLPLGVFLVTQGGNVDPRARARGDLGRVNLFFDPPVVTTNAGETLKFDVKIETNQDTITGAEIIINYDPSLLSLQGKAAEGPLFKNFASYSREGQVILSGEGEVIGQGTMASLNFRASGLGETDLELDPSSSIWGKVGQGNLLGKTNGVKITIE